MKNRSKILWGLGAAWLFTVVGGYFYTHFDVIATPLHPLFELVDITRYFLVILVLGVLGFVVFKKLLPQKLKLSAVFLICLYLFSLFFFGYSRFFFNDFGVYHGDYLVQTEEGVAFYRDVSEVDPSLVLLFDGKISSAPIAQYGEVWDMVGDKFESVSLIPAAWYMVVNLFVPLGLLIGLLLAVYVYGSFVVRRLDVGGLKGFLYSMGLGFMIMGLVLLGGLFTGYYNPYVFWAVLAGMPLVLIIIDAEHYWDILKGFFKWRSAPLSDISVLSFVSIASIVAFFNWNLVQSFALFPSAFDDFILYMYLPRELYFRGEFLWGYMPYAFALVQSLGIFMAKSATSIAQSVTSVCSLFAALAAYVFARKYLSKGMSWFVAAFLMSLPVVFYHGHVDLKVEMPLMFLSFISLLALDDWFDTGKKKWLFLSCLIAGYMVSVKLTALLFALVLVLVILTVFFRNLYLERTKYLKQGVIGLILCAVFMAIPVLPWIGLHSYSYGQMVTSVAELSHSHNVDAVSVSYDELLVDASQCSSPGGDYMDYGKYMSDVSGVWSFVQMPWNYVMQISLLSPATDLGPVFLAILPIGLVALLMFRRKEGFGWKGLLYLGAGVAYWVIWAFLYKQVLWYGITGFVFLFILLIASLSLVKKDSIKKGIAIGVLSVLVLTSIFWRGNWYVSRMNVQALYLGGELTFSEYVNNRFHDHFSSIGVLNSDMDSKIYATNVQTVLFFVNNGNERVYADRYIDFFSCLDQFHNGDGDAILSDMQATGFDYVLFYQPVYDPTLGEDLYNANMRLLQFSEEYLYYAGGDGNFFTYAIPPAI